jgi:hypothetical protein
MFVLVLVRNKLIVNEIFHKKRVEIYKSIFIFRSNFEKYLLKGHL